jgi:hypothetical protein
MQVSDIDVAQLGGIGNMVDICLALGHYILLFSFSPVVALPGFLCLVVYGYY